MCPVILFFRFQIRDDTNMSRAATAAGTNTRNFLLMTGARPLLSAVRISWQQDAQPTSSKSPHFRIFARQGSAAHWEWPAGLEGTQGHKQPSATSWMVECSMPLPLQYSVASISTCVAAVFLPQMLCTRDTSLNYKTCRKTWREGHHRSAIDARPHALCLNQK